MGWYKVTKNIGGRLYDYWQRSKRIGKKVKTECKYIGPAMSGTLFSPTTSTKAETLGARERREDERIQYGPLSARIKRQAAAVRRAQRNTTGIKKLNPFIAQGIKRE